MWRMSLFGVAIRVHPTMLLMALVAWRLGMGQKLIIATASLLVHEACHLLAAKALKLRVLEMELMPFGGAARIDALWSLRPGQLALVILSGPASNLMIALICAALGWWGLMDVQWAGLAIRINTMLMAFNLIPALPLDGGRILCGLLSTRMAPERALRIGIWAGRGLAVLLIGAAAAAFFRGGPLNLTLLLCAVYIFACAILRCSAHPPWRTRRAPCGPGTSTNCRYMMRKCGALAWWMSGRCSARFYAIPVFRSMRFCSENIKNPMRYRADMLYFDGRIRYTTVISHPI